MAIVAGLTLTTSVDAAQLTLRWTDHSDGTAVTWIERRTAESEPFVPIGQVAPSIVSYVDPTVMPGTTYCYRVAASIEQVASEYSNEACAIAPVDSTPLVNVAAQVNGGVASASSTHSAGYPVSAVNDGDRRGINPSSRGYWNDGTPDVTPDWVEIRFDGPKAISEIDVFTLQDAYTTPVEPTPAMTFSLYGLTDFEIEYWTGMAWATVPGGAITGNTAVWRRVSFPTLTTDRIRVVVTRTPDAWSRIVEIEAWSGVVPPPTTVNVAAKQNGGVAVASSTHSAGFPVSAVIDGDRRGIDPGNGGYWNDATPDATPDWVQISFAGARTISEIGVFALQDDYTAPVEPTLAMTFSLYGLTDFEIQYWTGTAWVTVPGGSITGNTAVWRRVTFPPLTTEHIRVVVTGTRDTWSRIVEIEAW